MKTLRSSFIIIMMLGIFSFAPQHGSAQESQVSFQVFYDGLSPYGQWVDYPGQGYVWIPTADNFRPYCTSGHWVFTDEGWTWVSDYPWGWAPFHYGRWDHDANYGWMWIPGEQWSCAWVSWRTCDGYYGWAPMGSGDGEISNGKWNFVDEHHMGDPNISRYYAPRNQNVTYINRSTVINRSGPSREAVEKSTGHPVTPYVVKSNASPGQSVKGNELSMYRATVSKTTSSSPKPMPAKVAKATDLPKHTATRQNTSSPSQKVNQPAKQQVVQHQHVVQPAKQQPAKQQHPAQPTRQQQAQKQPAQQHQNRQQPAQQQHAAQPARQQPAQQEQHTAQPARQEPAQQEQHAAQPARQEPAQQEQRSQPENQGGEQHPH